MPTLYSNDLCAAFVAEVANSFSKNLPSGLLGRTTMQKLVYFAGVLGVPIPCSFEIYNYGPYSEAVARSVDSLLADDVIVDTSSNERRYSNYRVGAHFAELPDRFRSVTGRYRQQIDEVVQKLGILRPETLELGSTLHFLNAKHRAIHGSAPEKTLLFKELKEVKGDKFTDEQIEQWYQALASSNLL